jgi:Flp pilus assembly protein TadG
MRWPMKLGGLVRMLRDARGVAALEFALVVPAVIVLYAGGYEIAQAATVNRKVTDTTVQLANVTSQYTTVANTDISQIFAASSQIMLPYSTTPLTITLSEVQADSTGSVNSKVIWSQSYVASSGTVGAGLATGSTVIMPTGLPSPNQYYILVQTTYLYTPTVGAAFVNNIPMSDQIFMIPRESSQIPCTTC